MRNGNAAGQLADVDGADQPLVLATADEPGSDRRTDERFLTVFRLAKLIGGREGFCLVRNVSAGGLKAQAFSPKAVGDKLSVDFGDEHPLAARVAWVKGDLIGVSFDDKIDITQALSKAPSAGGAKARPIRLMVELDAMVTTPTWQEHCQLLDISQGGAKIKMKGVPRTGDDIVLEIPDLGRFGCVVRWVKKGNVGLAFPGQLPYRELAAWVGGLNKAA